MWGRLKFVYEAPNWIALNQTMQSQTMVSIAKVSCEIWALLGYYAAQSGDSWPTLLDNLLAPSSKVKKSKRENSTTKVHWHSIFWGVSVHRLIFERSTMFQKPALFLFSNKEAPNLVELFSITAHHTNSTLLRYAPENKFSPRVVTRKLFFF